MCRTSLLSNQPSILLLWWTPRYLYAPTISNCNPWMFTGVVPPKVNHHLFRLACAPADKVPCDDPRPRFLLAPFWYTSNHGFIIRELLEVSVVCRLKIRKSTVPRGDSTTSNTQSWVLRYFVVWWQGIWRTTQPEGAHTARSSGHLTLSSDGCTALRALEK